MLYSHIEAATWQPLCCPINHFFRFYGMKKSFLLIILFSLFTTLHAQKVMKVWSSQGVVEIAISEIDSITFYGEEQIVGEFSVSSNKRITFSPGNLQYVTSTDEWIFAPNQYDYIGIRNMAGQAFADTIDLFAWSTDTDPSTAWGVTLTDDNNLLKGNFVDWGNAVANGNTWRTLTSSEWEYLRASRKNAKQLIGIGSVNGKNGLILLPDNWQAPEGITFKSGYSSEEYSATAFAEYQSFTIEQWTSMQNAGAVFLPCAGFRIGTSLAYMQFGGFYWTSSLHASQDPRYAAYFLFMCDGAGVGYDMRSSGNAVRLVRDL